MYRENKYLALLPAVILIGLLFWGGLFYGLIQSFGLFQIVGESKFTMDIYNEVLRSDWFIESLLFTVKISLISSMISGLMAVFVLYILFITAKKNKLMKILRKLFTSPMLIPYLVSGYLITVMFMRSGWLSSLSYYFGLIDKIGDFPILTNEKNGISIILTYIWKTSPFIVLMSYPVLLRIEERWFDAGKILGASKGRFFIELIMPLLMPSLLSSVFIVFAYIFSSFEVPYLLGVSHPKSLSVLSYEIYSKGELEMRSYVMVINVLISLVTFITGIGVYYINKNYIVKKQRGWK